MMTLSSMAFFATLLNSLSADVRPHHDTIRFDGSRVRKA